MKAIICIATVFLFFACGSSYATDETLLDITLNAGDVAMLKDFLSKSPIHVTQSDNSTHAFVDGTTIWMFLQEKEVIARSKKANPPPIN